MQHEVVKSDITVIGGGLAGVSAAVAAARLGRKVALVQNRPMLGGNSSSEVRVWVCGATAHGINRYARETGVMGEMFVENQYRNPDGNPYFWDMTILETVRAEANIRLFLNTNVHEVEADGDELNRIIRSVTGWMMGSEKKLRFESEMFLDCTGDGLVGFLAGAKYRIGREAKHEYDEEWAPEEADGITLGSTILFYTKDAGHPVKYVPPTFAKNITETSIPMKRVIRSGDSGCHYWWIEWGGLEHIDIVHDNEQIRDELWAAIYGIWDYIKNSGQFDADNMTLEWVGSLPGKREYRRFVGDYVLNQNDIVAQRPFEDRVAFGGWSIDLHPPEGMYAKESGSKHMHTDGIYHIPFRSLYSVNVANLLFAGRDLSASHVAFGTTRVMATCAVIGEAAGSGAALCVEKGVTPRELYHRHMKELQQVMLRQDASIIGLAGEDGSDLAKRARVSASSTCKRLAAGNDGAPYKLQSDIGILVPVDPKLESIEFLLDAGEDTELEVELWDTGKKENYVPANQRCSAVVAVRKGERQWVKASLEYYPDEPQNAFVIVRANPHIRLYVSDKPQTGLLTFEKAAAHLVSQDLEERSDDFPVVKWSMRKMVRKMFAIKVSPATQAFEPNKVIDGYVRPYGGPHMWVSGQLDNGREEWIELSWSEETKVRTIHLTFNDDVNEDLINLHHHRTPFEIIPELVKDYRIEAWRNGNWVAVLAEQNNHKRKRIHQLSEHLRTERLRLVVESTNGSDFAEVIEMRVYG